MKLKEGLYWLFFLTICFGAGFLHGSLPQNYLSKKLTADPTITIAISEPRWKTETFQVILEEALNQEVSLKVFASLEELLFQLSQNSDIDYGIIPSSWATILHKDQAISTFNPVTELAPDFNLDSYEIPLFWKFENEQLNVYSFVALKKSSTIKHHQKRLHQILKKPTYEILLKETGLSGTLERLEMQSLKKELKPSFLRSLPLNQIKQRN